MIISCWILLKTRNVSEKICREIQRKMYILNFFFFSENRAVCEIKWENIVERDRPQMTIWRMRNSCRIPKATNTHSEYVILITFPLQQWWQERSSVLRYTYIAAVVTNKPFQKRQFHFKSRDETKLLFARDRCQTVAGAFWSYSDSLNSGSTDAGRSQQAHLRPPPTQLLAVDVCVLGWIV